MFRHSSLVAAPLAWLVTTATLLAQADPLAVIPDDALGVAVVYNISDTSARVGKVAGKMQIPAPDLLGLAKSFAGIEKGLDEKGSVAAALFSDPMDEDGFGLAVVVPVTDYKEFIGQLGPDDADARIAKVKIVGREALVAKKGSFAVFTDADQNTLLEKILASSKNVTTVIEPLRAWAAEQQAVVVVTPKGKSLLVKKLVSLMPDTPAGAGADPANPLAAVGEMLRVFKRLLTAADEQLTHLAAGVRINDNASFRVSVKLPFVPAGKLAVWAKDVPAPPAARLAGLPTGKYVLVYGGVSVDFSGEFSEIVSQLSDFAFRQIGASEEARKKTAELLAQQRREVQSNCTLLGAGQPGQSMFSGVISIERVKSADQYLKASRALFETMQAALKGGENDEPLYEFHEMSVGELKALELVTNFEALSSGAGPQAGMMKAVFGRMFGNDGKMHSYLAAADDRTVVMAYNKDQLQRAVAQVRSGGKGLEADPEIARTTAMLMPGSQWVVYVSPQGVVEWVEVLLRGMFGAENQFRLPAFAPTEPIGLAAKVAPAGLEAEIVVPESVVAGIGQFIGAAQGMFGAGAAPPLP